MSNELVTIAVTTKDRPEMARRAIRSALGQDHPAIEVIAVDDGSHPPFDPEVVDDRFRLLRRDRAGGPCAARNEALAAAKGAWITFLDDDDCLLPHMVSSSLAAAAASPRPQPVAVLSTIRVVDGRDAVSEERVPPALDAGSHYFLEPTQPGRSFGTHNSLLAPVSVMVAIGGWDETMTGTEHDDLFLRLNQACSIEAVVEAGYVMSAHGGDRRSTDVLARARAMEYTASKHADLFAKHPQRTARYFTVMGVTYVRGGQRRPAVAAIWRSLRIAPFRLRSWLYLGVAVAGPAAWRLGSRVAGDRWSPPRP